MKYRRYAEYKDSGVEWLGEVPAHWEVCLVKRHFEVELGKMLDQAKQNGAGTRKPYLRAANIHWDRLKLDDINEMEFSDSQMERYRLQPGDLLVTEGGVTVGRSALWRGELDECYYQNSLNRVRPLDSSPISARYLLYWMDFTTNAGYVDLVADKATFGHLTNEKLNSFPLVAPRDKEEVAAIISFLDYETAQINVLIDKQELLIAVLQEKRQALISHAVTKGLDPAAPMKDSGVEWLGEVPAHWDLTKLGHCLHRIEAGWTPDSIQQPASDDEWAVVKVGCVREGEFFPDEHKVLAPGVPPAPQIEIHAGDLIMSRANTTELVGSIGLVRQTRPRLTLCDKTYRLILREQLLTEYANYLLQARVARHQIELAASGASPSMKNISQESVRALSLPIPPVAVQERIVCHLDTAMVSHRKICEAVERAIERLRERRAALISAAVTGKIDVRS